ncbi:MAG: patatin-like phospholipase family protein [Alphaproteobacteria bacterium]|nr:patatin-like phospholipase family protein [Alphaproteobacteria bacterium]
MGLALGGGVARGFAHIGILKALRRHHIRPSIVVGTSIGALVGGAYLAGKLDEFEDWALSLNRMRLLSYLDFRIRSAGMIGGNRLKKLMDDALSDIKIEDLPSPYIAIASDLLTGHEVWLRKGNLIEAMTASFSLPGVLPPVRRNGRLLVDGALVNPVPVAPAQALGARMTIAVDLNTDIVGKALSSEDGYPRVAGFDMFNDKDVPPEAQKEIKSGLTNRLFRREEHNPSLFGVMVSALSIMQDRLTRSRLAGDPPDIHLKPMIGHIGLLEFERAKELIERGEEEAERAIPDIRNAMQVFLPPQTDDVHY